MFAGYGSEERAAVVISTVRFLRRKAFFFSVCCCIRVEFCESSDEFLCCVRLGAGHREAQASGWWGLDEAQAAQGTLLNSTPSFWIPRERKKIAALHPIISAHNVVWIFVSNFCEEKRIVFVFLSEHRAQIYRDSPWVVRWFSNVKEEILHFFNRGVQSCDARVGCVFSWRVCCAAC